MAGRRSTSEAEGTVVATRGRRVAVDLDGIVTTCFLSGHRAVVGDRVRAVPAPGEGGKITEVLPRTTVLTRCEPNGREEVLAANLGGLLVCASVASPPYRPGLVDRFAVGASADELPWALVLTKVDLGVGPSIEADLARWEANGVPILRVSVSTGEGIEALRAFLARQDGGPWCLVGHSGVGKTSLVAALLPGVDVGPIGDISAYWDQGRHTTTGGRLFTLPGGGAIADSPGIRSFLPGGLTPELVRDHFPGLHGLRCRYRDCLHREGEEGCAAPAALDPEVLVRYRRLLSEVAEIDARRR